MLNRIIKVLAIIILVMAIAILAVTTVIPFVIGFTSGLAGSTSTICEACMPSLPESFNLCLSKVS